MRKHGWVREARTGNHLSSILQSILEELHVPRWDHGIARHATSRLVWGLVSKGFWGSNSDPLYQLTPQPLVFYNPYFGTFEFSLPNICYFREKIKDGGHNLSVGCLPSKHNALHWIRSTQNTQVNSIGPLQKNKMPRSGMKYKMIVSLRTAGSDLGSRLSTDQLPSLICSWQGEFLAWQSLQQSPYEHSANDLSLQVRPSQHGSDSHSCEQKTVPSK